MPDWIVNVDVLQSLIPVIMSGILAVYSLVVSVLIAEDMQPDASYSLYTYVEHDRAAAHGSQTYDMIP